MNKGLKLFFLSILVILFTVFIVPVTVHASDINSEIEGSQNALLDIAWVHNDREGTDQAASVILHVATFKDDNTSDPIEDITVTRDDCDVVISDTENVEHWYYNLDLSGYRDGTITTDNLWLNVEASDNYAMCTPGFFSKSDFEGTPIPVDGKDGYIPTQLYGYTSDEDNSQDITVTTVFEGTDEQPEFGIVSLQAFNKGYEPVYRYVSNVDDRTNFTATFHVPKEYDGHELSFVANGVNLDGYTKTVKQDGKNFVVTYSSTSENTKTFSGRKIWEGDKQENRPSESEVQLLKNGVVAASAVINEENDWCFSFENMPIEETASYTIEENPGIYKDGYPYENTINVDDNTGITCIRATYNKDMGTDKTDKTDETKEPEHKNNYKTFIIIGLEILVALVAIIYKFKKK